MSYATLLTTTKKGVKIMNDFKETISQHFNHADEFELDTIIDLEIKENDLILIQPNDDFLRVAKEVLKQFKDNNNNNNNEVKK
jgi:gas vesicle protein